MSTVQLSDTELVWLYLAIPLTATQDEVEMYIRRQAPNLAEAFVSFQKQKEKEQEESKQNTRGEALSCSLH